ncbi:hypothetical protein [Bacillus pumilus]|uniref:hypothetical protein n=1 Tax=Bacillus pumilus TaxID=1408 RepID=UPI0021B3E5E1|nr:hypothetical protein [Bacillus pumilus]
MNCPYNKKNRQICRFFSQRVDKPSHSVSVLRAGAHECQIRSAPVLVLPRLQRFSITLKRRQRAKINFILALCQQSEEPANMPVLFFCSIFMVD